MRHAKTEEQKANQSDYERNLVERGKNDALSMANILKEKNFLPEIIIASSANRTVQTAEIVAQTLQLNNTDIQLHKSLYLCNSRELANIIEAVDESVKSCCIIAHNPGISEFAFDINRAAISEALPTAAFVVYSFVADSWQDLLLSKNKIELYEYPKK
jgi:phosphohistidine phosphatase